MDKRFIETVGIQHPIICGAMYPCSNIDLISAASEAGGIGIIQPLTLTYVFRQDLRTGIQTIRSRTKKPVGFNAIIEKASKIYEDRMRRWIDVALEEGVRFFITALGNPRWVLDRVKPVGGIVYHDVINLKWAEKALEGGVDGLICVNNRAGGHAGTETPEKLFKDLSSLGVPLICAGGIGDENDYREALQIGYAGVQMGTRFIATKECGSHADYKNAIVRAKARDIVHTERVTGVPLAVIRTPYVDKVGLKVGPISRRLFKIRRTKYLIRAFYQIKALVSMKRSSLRGVSTKDYYQAGKSVEHIDKIETVASIFDRFTR